MKGENRWFLNLIQLGTCFWREKHQKLKGFNKTELDDLKFAIVMNGIKNYSTLPKYLDELVSENNLDEEEQEILQTLFKEVSDYFNAD